jgi:DNA gyrase subunit A
MGRQARGVKGISLDAGDIVVAADIVTSEKTMLTVTENGYGKRTELDEYKSQGRAGKGIITIKTTERNGKVIGAVQVEDTNEIMIVTNIGKLIRMKVADISVIGRNTQGVRLVNVAGDEKVVDVSVISGEDPIE